MKDDTILYYVFDFDDNILNMSSEIIVLNDKNEEVGISTHDFSKYRNIIGKRLFKYKNNIIVDFPRTEDGEINDPLVYRNFGDILDPNIFIKDIKKALKLKSYGPAWDDFMECIINGSPFSIITARGHESKTIRKGIEYIINNELSDIERKKMYSNLLDISYLSNSEFISDIKFTDNKLLKEYLDSCDYIGISAPSRGGQPHRVEMAKSVAMVELKTKINLFGKRLGRKVKIGFSDDDPKNIKQIDDLFKDVRYHDYSHIIQYTVKNTNNPNNIVKTIRNIE